MCVDSLCTQQAQKASARKESLHRDPLSWRIQPGAPPSPRLCFCGYSIFDSALYRSLKVEWLFPQEKATLHDLTMATRESKML
jgi:hypothetical protein